MESSSTTKKNKILISGSYGTGNVGDEIILKSLEQAFEKFNLTVLSQNCIYTKKFFPKLNVTPQSPSWEPLRILKDLLRMRLQTIKDRITFIYHVIKTDIFLLGGGGLLAELIPAVLRYYLLQIKIAHFFGKKIIILGVGIGPLQTPRGINNLRKTLNRIHPIIIVRDQHSKKLLRNADVSCPIDVCPDLAFFLDQPQKSKAPSPKITINIYEPFTSQILWDQQPERHQNFIHTITIFLNYLSERYDIQLLPFGTNTDYNFCKSLNIQNCTIHNNAGDPQVLYQELAHSRFTITMRFHAGLLSMAANVPSICIDTQFKSSRLLKEMELEEMLISLPDGKHQEGFIPLELQLIKDKIDYVENNYQIIQNKIEHYTTEAKNKVSACLKELCRRIDENTL